MDQGVRKVKKLQLFVSVILMMAMVIAGCSTYQNDNTGNTSNTSPSANSGKSSGDGGNQAENDTEQAETTFTYVADQPVTLNMIKSGSNLDNYVFYHISAMLFRPYNGVMYPELSESFEVSEDRTVYTYRLKEATYSDGTPITAHDFAYYLLAQFDPEQASPNGANLISKYGFKNAAAYREGNATLEEVGVKALDDLTLEITLEKPIATFDGALDIYPLNEEFAKSKGEKLGGSAADLMYSGPYILTEWAYDSYLSFTKNPTYIDAENSFPTTHLRHLIIPDHNTRVTMFENGEVDALLTISPEYESVLQDYITHRPSSATQGVQFNIHGKGQDAKKSAILSNADFRKALGYALNREAIGNVVNPTHVPTSRYLSQILAGKTVDSVFTEDFPMKGAPVQGDVEQAKQFLDKALKDLGYDDVSKLPELEFLTFDADSYRKTVEAIVDTWKQQLGLANIKINLLPVPQAIQAMMTYDYDLYYQSLGVGRDASEFLAYFTKNGAVNTMSPLGLKLYENTAYDALIEQSFSTFDRAERMALLAQAEQMLLDDGVIQPLFNDGHFSAIQPYVEGFTFHAYDEAHSFKELRVNK